MGSLGISQVMNSQWNTTISIHSNLASIRFMAMKKDDKISIGLSGTNFPAVVTKNPLYMRALDLLLKGVTGIVTKSENVRCFDIYRCNVLLVYQLQ